MKSIVVVDDEIRQCRGLKHILCGLYPDWQVEGFTDAFSALTYIKQNNTRLIVTDICMPELDGLAMTEQIKEADAGARVVLLTGFAEFEYARKALTLGAYDYLLKPLNPEKIKAVLDKAMEEMNADEILASKQEQMQKTLDVTLPVYMENLLNQWVYGKTSKEEQKEIEKIIPSKKEGFVIAIHFFGLEEWQQEKSKEEVAEIKNQLIWWVRESLKKPFHAISFFSHIQAETLVTVVVQAKSKERLPSLSLLEKGETYERLPQPLQEKFLEGKLQIVTGIGSYAEQIAETIVSCYQSAQAILPYGFYFAGKEGYLVLKAEYLLPKTIDRMHISLGEEEWFKDTVRKGEKEKACDILETLAVSATAHGYPEPQRFISFFENLLRHTALLVSAQLGIPDVTNTMLSGMDHQNMERFLACLKRETCQLADCINERNSRSSGAFAERFYTYLDAHFAQELSLSQIADYFGFSETYFSARVREETGDSFSKILLRLRTDKAKELLRGTDLKIYEIAAQTGYADVKYFNRVFKRETGLTPICYREEMEGVRVEQE